MEKTRNLLEALEYFAAQHPDKNAFNQLDDDCNINSSLTYGQLNTKVLAVAAFLQQHLKPGDRALLIYPAGLDYIVAFFACLCAGITAVPVYPPINKAFTERIQHITDNARPTLFLTNTEIYTHIKKLLRAKIIAKLPFLNQLITMKKLDEYANWEFDKFTWLVTDHIAIKQANKFEKVDYNLNKIAFLQYTSGATSLPKGVIVTNDSITANLKAIHHSFQINSNGNGITWLPPYHDMGLIGGILEVVYSGGSSCLITPQQFLKKPLLWLEAISRYKLEISGGPSFAYQLVIKNTQNKKLENLDLSTWRLAFCGAQPIEAHTLQAFAHYFSAYGFKQSAFFPCYGMGEATLYITGKQPASAEPTLQGFDAAALQQHKVMPSDKPDTKILVGCGVSPGEQELYIVNPKTKQRCAIDEVGEIYVSSPSVTLGYWEQPELTQNTFNCHVAEQKGNFLATGDLGFLYNNELFVTGRLKELIIIRGQNYYPHDIEKAIEAVCPEIRSGCSAACAANINDEEVLVIIAEYRKKEATNEDVIARINTVLSEAFGIVAAQIVLIHTHGLLKTTSGKIRRKQNYLEFLNGKLPIVKLYTHASNKLELPPRGNNTVDSPLS